MKESYRLYQEQLTSHLGELSNGVPLASSLQPSQKLRHTGEGGHDRAFIGKADGAALVSAVIQWIGVLWLCLLVYCWWHRSEPHWGLPPGMLAWLPVNIQYGNSKIAWRLPLQPVELLSKLGNVLTSAIQKW